MRINKKSFLEMVIAGSVNLDEIDDYVDRWHDNPGNLSLREYLGFSVEDYAAWALDAGCLKEIVCRMRAQSEKQAQSSPVEAD